MMGPQYLHRLLFPSHYFLLCHIMCRRPTAYTRCCCSLYCAIRRWRAMSAQHSNNCAADTSYTVIIAITGTPTFRRTETDPGKPGAQTPLPFLRGVWVPRLTRVRVRESIRRVDPLNTPLCWGGGLHHRRPYSVPGPNSLWHLSNCNVSCSVLRITSNTIYFCVQFMYLPFYWCRLLFSSPDGHHKLVRWLFVTHGGRNRWVSPNQVCYMTGPLQSLVK